MRSSCCIFLLWYKRDYVLSQAANIKLMGFVLCSVLPWFCMLSCFVIMSLRKRELIVSLVAFLLSGFVCLCFMSLPRGNIALSNSLTL